jgi:hypothetical protein
LRGVWLFRAARMLLDWVCLWQDLRSKYDSSGGRGLAKTITKETLQINK